MEPNLLVRSVEQLTGELRGFREVLEEIREEFLWVTRSGGVRARRVEFVRVKRMAIDPCAEDWGEKLELERAMYDPSGRVSPLESQLVERVVCLEAEEDLVLFLCVGISHTDTKEEPVELGFRERKCAF